MKGIGFENCGMGRPVKNINKELLRELSGLNCSYAEMSRLIGVAESTLTRRYAQVIKEGRETVKTSLKRKQYEVAMNGNPTLLIWLGKIIVGQKEKVETERDFELTIITKIVDLTKSGKKVEVKSKRKSVSRKSKVVSKN